MDEELASPTAAALERSHLCFIYRLPTETLEGIFIQCAHDYYGAYRGFPIPCAPSWVSVSYVSLRWRNVALNCPTLWTYLFITSLRWTEELLARSKRAPLKLDVTMFPLHEERRAFRSVEQVMKHSERIQ